MGLAVGEYRGLVECHAGQAKATRRCAGTLLPAPELFEKIYIFEPRRLPEEKFLHLVRFLFPNFLEVTPTAQGPC